MHLVEIRDFGGKNGSGDGRCLLGCNVVDVETNITNISRRVGGIPNNRDRNCSIVI